MFGVVDLIGGIITATQELSVVVYAQLCSFCIILCCVCY